MSKPTGSDGKGSSKIATTPHQQDQVRRATKAGRNRKTKGTVNVEHFIESGARLQDVGGVAARRKVQYDKARRTTWRRQRDEALLKTRKAEYARKGQAMLALRQQMNQSESDYDRLKDSLDTAPKYRHADIRSMMHRIEGKLRGMQRKYDSLDTRIKELDALIFSVKVG